MNNEPASLSRDRKTKEAIKEILCVWNDSSGEETS
jgi:hypothetical protein